MIFNIDDFINAYGLADKRDSFSGFKVQGAVYLKKRDEIILKIENDHILPYAIYHDLKDYLEGLLKHDLTLYIKTNDQRMSLAEITAYLKDYSKDTCAFKSALPIIKDEVLTIHYDQKKHYESDEVHFDDLKTYFKNIGYVKELAFSYQKENTTFVGEIEIEPQRGS